MAEKNPAEINYEVNGEEVKLSPQIVKQYLVNGNPNVTDQEVVMFMQLAKFQKLNPFLNEVYLVKFGSTPASIITSKEAFMKRAESNPHYKGFKAGILVQRGDEIKQLEGAVKLKNDDLIGGWAEIYRDDRKEPILVEIALEEFSKTDKNGNLQSTWLKMPNTMIRKTAIVNAMREAFPETLGALYTEDDANPKQLSNVTETVEESDGKLDELMDKKGFKPGESDSVLTTEKLDIDSEVGVSDDIAENEPANATDAG